MAKGKAKQNFTAKLRFIPAKYHISQNLYVTA